MSSKTKQRGQSMTEYIIIVALIALAGIAAYQHFGATVRAQTGAMAQEIAGQDSQAALAQAKTNADNAVAQGKATKGLANYGEGAQHGSGASGGQ